MNGRLGEGVYILLLLFCFRLPGVHILSRNRHHTEVVVGIKPVQPDKVDSAEEVE
jgi:hypothetical protein